MRRISQQDWENEHMHNPMTEGEALAVDVSKMLRGKVRDAAFGIATIEVDCSDLGPNTIGPGHEILIHNLTKNPLTAPPAAVPADASVPVAELVALAGKWLALAPLRPAAGDDALRACADELAALIPKGADHEQR